MSHQELTQEEFDIIIEDARFGDLEVLQEIFGELSPEILLDIKDEYTKNTTIHMAAANGHLETVKYLLGILPKEKAKVLVAQQNYEGNTALHWASLNGHLEIVKLLCEDYEADALVKNSFNHDAIFEAENNGKEEVESYLLKKYDVEPIGENEDVNIKISDKDTEVQVQPGHEIEQITKETMENLESNEKFLEERTKNLQL